MITLLNKLTMDRDGKISLAKTVTVGCVTVLFLAGSLWLGYKMLNAASTYAQVAQRPNKNIVILFLAGILWLGFFKRLYKIFAFYAGLRADTTEGRTFYFRMVRDSHGSNCTDWIPALQGNMAAGADNFKAKVFQRCKNLCFCRIAGKLAQGMATSVSAIKASLGILNFFKTFAPNVRMWKSSADLVSARASSYVFPSPTTTPSIPNGYPTYPSSSFDITIFMDRCIFISPSKGRITRGLNDVKNLNRVLYAQRLSSFADVYIRGFQV